VRCFKDDDVIHVNGTVDPVSDADTINFELALADVQQIEKRLERLKKGNRKSKEEQAAAEVCCGSHYQLLIYIDMQAHTYWDMCISENSILQRCDVAATSERSV
jgi:ribosome-binding ATPase YchF (GTP1/OBG family)